ncbi:MAG: histidine kinase [Sulfuriferula sp.]
MQDIGSPSAEHSESVTDQGLYKLPALRVLSEIAASLSTDSNIERLLERFLSTMVRLAGAGAGAVRVLTADGTGLRLIGSIGLGTDMRERESIVPLSCGVCGQAVFESVACNTEAMHICKNNSGLAFFGDCCVSFVAVPLQHKGQVLGVYNLFMFADAPSIPEDVRLLFSSISEHLGMALENARLTQENMRISLMNEREMLSNEIHDSLAQTLAYMNIRLEMLKESVHTEDKQFTEKYLGDMEDALESAYSGLRELLTQFRHSMDPRGLVPALQDLLAGTRKKTEARVDFVNHTQGLNLTPDQEVQVFHIVQEALANICKHSCARNIHLNFEQTSAAYRLTITDDGIGLYAVGNSDPDVHFGISIMQGRAKQLGGNLEISSRADEGTQVTLTFPSEPPSKVKDA